MVTRTPTDTVDLLRTVAADAEASLRHRFAEGAAPPAIRQPYHEFLEGAPDPDLLSRRAVYSLMLKVLLMAEVCRRRRVTVPRADTAEDFVERADGLAASTGLAALRRNVWDDLLVEMSPDGHLFGRVTALVASLTETDVGPVYQALVEGPERRALGQFYTPPDVARFMAWWAVRSPKDRVLDPGTGAGAFLVAAHQCLRDVGAGDLAATRQLYGVDIDPLSTLMASLNLLLTGAGSQVNMLTGDFLLGTPPLDLEFDAAICNPPYSRHHALPGQYKEHIAQVVEDLGGVRLSRLSSLYVHFFIRAACALRDGGRLAFITPHEFLDVGYGKALKRFLAKHFDLKAFILFPEDALVFPGVLTTSCITLAERGRTDGNEVRFVKADKTAVSDELYEAVGAPAGRTDGYLVNVILQSELAPEARWTPHLRPRPKRPPSKALVPLGDLAKAHRGVATGSNDFFILTREAVRRWGIEKRFLRPAVSSAKMLAHYELTDEDVDRIDAEGRRLWLLYWPTSEPIPEGQRVLEYIRHGEQEGVNKTYLCRHRKLWYSTELRQPAPIIFTYMSRQRPRFVYDRVGVQATNVFHLIYPVPEISEDTDKLKALLAFLNCDTGKRSLWDSARVYGGGLVKAEPSELQALPVLDVSKLSKSTAKALAEAFDRLCLVKRSGGDVEASQADIDRAVKALL